MQRIETPILIVGGGPVGLSLALDLAWRGVRTLLVERGDGVVRNPKTGHISMRSMEFFRRWGIAKRIRQCGFPSDYELSMVFCTSMSGHLLARHHYPSMGVDTTPPFTPENKQRAPQMFSDPILAAAVREHDSVEVLYGTEFLGFEDRGDRVVSRIRDAASGVETEVESQFLAACDGAASGIRRTLGIAMEGDPALNYSIAIYIRAPELTRRHDKGEAERYIFIGPEGTWGNLTVVDGRELWRLTVMGSEERIERAGVDPHHWLRLCFGEAKVDYEVLSSMPWRRSRLVAGRYSQGRVFLIGDSAHTMSPTGGFGMNTGIGDAVDMGWKFQAAVNGWAGAKLLDSYDIERRPVGWRNVNAAADNFHKMMSATDCSRILEAGPEGDAIRARVGEQIRLATLKEWESHGVVLGYRYEGSPIIVPDGTSEPDDDPSDYRQTSRPGHRAPHARLSDGRSTLDLFGRGFTLLVFPGAPGVEGLTAAAAARGLPLTVERIDDPAIAALYERRLVLVRPDGHSAWRGDAPPADPLAVIDRVRGAIS